MNFESCNNDDNNEENYINLVPFLLCMINQNKNIKILAVLSKNIFFDNQFFNKLKYYKEVNINFYLEMFKNKYCKNLDGDNSNYYKDLILYDKKNLERIFQEYLYYLMILIIFRYISKVVQI